MTNERADLLIRGSRLLVAMDAERKELEGGWVTISNGLVDAICTGTPPPARETIDATVALVAPGLVNTHHHL